MRAILLAVLLPTLACGQNVALQGKAEAKSEAGPTQKVVPLSGTASASGGSKTK